MCRDYSLRRFCEEWRIWIRPLLILTYAIFAIIVVPLLIVNTVKDGFTRRDQLILIGGLFVLSAVPVSIWHIIQHVIHFTKPILQKHIIRILWMVPIYALNAVSCISLWTLVTITAYNLIHRLFYLSISVVRVIFSCTFCVRGLLARMLWGLCHL